MKLYTNEIVFRGHPDKVCDQISDAILDAYLEKDENSRCAIETVGGKGIILVTGEVTSKANINVEEIVLRVLNDVGYPLEYRIINNIGVQSKDIALGTNDKAGGAGDNGMMFGYACRVNDKLLPTAQVILQEFAMEYDKLRQEDSRFLPDGKAQITGKYDGYDLKSIKTFTICYQNTEKERDKTDKILIDIANNIAKKYNVKIEEYLINPTGRFKIGGFEGDTGLTGRKIVVDSYHSFAKVGGGAFSGKDATKVDRSGAYKAREIAKDVLKQNPEIYFAEVQLSYAIGKPQPLAIYITSDKGDLDVPESLYEACSLNNIIKDLELKKPGFEKRARFGHFID